MDPRENLLLQALPDEEYDRLVATMTEVTLDHGRVLYEQDQPVTEVYFPTSGAVSLIIVMENGMSMEPGIVGREGMLGFPIGLSDDVSRWQSVVQIDGEAMSMPREVMQAQLARSGDLNPLLTHYAGLLVTLVAQSAACAQFHRVRERATRWLLMMHDRANSDEFALTHDHFAAMAGTHRPSVTVALQALRAEGLIETPRGRVRILDRRRLEDETCECYRRVQMRYDEPVQVRANERTGGYRASGSDPYHPAP